MSTIFGIYNRDETFVPSEIFDGMHDAVSYWNPDESGHWIEDEVALGHEMLWNSAQSKNEHLPVKTSRFVLTMDARLDNRKELLSLLGIEKDKISIISDSELILAAYDKWGTSCPVYLVGDFSFAIWDKSKKSLFCVRDHLGVRPLYYHAKEELFVFGNDLKGLIAHPKISKELSDEAVTYYLTGVLKNTKRTFYHDIQKLPAAHYMVVSSDSIEVERYWRPEKIKKIKLAGIDDYASRLRKLVEQAVYDRMRTDYPVTAHLSGGLDSSAIAIIAARKLREQDERLSAFNWLHTPGDGDESENFEWANSLEIANKEKIEHSYVSLNSLDIEGYLKEKSIVHGDSSGLWYEYPVRQAAQQKGARTILSGWGGDQFATYHGRAYLANLFRDGNAIELCKYVFLTKKGARRSLMTSLKMLYHGVFTAFIPRNMYHRMPKSKMYELGYSIDLFKEDFLEKFNDELEKCTVVSPQVWSSIKNEMLNSLEDGILQDRTESWFAGALENRLEYSYPLLDKRVVEFMLSIPAYYFMHDHKGRYIFRKAMDSIIPDQVLWEDKKLEQNRVNKLIDISVVAFKNVIHHISKQEGDSTYINLHKLQNVLTQEGASCNSLIARQVSLALSVVMAGRLN